MIGKRKWGTSHLYNLIGVLPSFSNSQKYASWNCGFPGLPGSANGKEPTCQCRRHRRLGFDPWVQKISWRGTWQLSPVFLPGKSHGQRSLAGYSPWSQSQTWLNQLIMHTHVSCRDLPPQTSFLLFPDIQRFWQTLWRKPKKIYRRQI